MGRKDIVTYVLAIVKIMCVVIIALGVPWLIKHDGKPPAASRPLLGIEEFTDTMLTSIVPDCDVCSYRAGLVVDAHTYNTVVSKHIDLLYEKGVCISTVFVLDDGTSCAHQKMPPGVTVVPIKKNQYDLLAHYDCASFDCIMIDVQETGFITYDGEPLLASLKMASAAHKPVIVFDRPNMLGASIEGFGVWLGGRALIPFRHGMTIGELAKFCNRHVIDTPIALHVVQMKHYQRLAHDPDRAHIMSQYCMRGLIDMMHEIKPFEVRISPDNAYHCIMLPVDAAHSKRMWRALSVRLKRIGIDSTLFTYSNDATGATYVGLNLSVQNVATFSVNSALLTVLRFFNDNGLHITYSERLRDMIGLHAVQSYLAGTVTEQEAHQALEHEAKLFFSKAAGSFLYQPLPKVVSL